MRRSIGRLAAGLILAVAVILGVPATADAAQETTEDRLREVLRKMTVDLRAAQDSQAAAQAQLQQAQAERDRLAQQVDSLNARIAELPAAGPPAAAPAAPPAAAAAAAELAQLQAALQAAEAQNRALQAGLRQVQAAYQAAAQVARAKTAESEERGRNAASFSARFDLCMAENHKLTGVAGDILHLYRTQSFRSLLIGSYEPLLGLKEVDLQNTVQDYEDRIYAHRLYGNEQPPAAKPAGAPAAGAPGRPAAGAR